MLHADEFFLLFLHRACGPFHIFLRPEDLSISEGAVQNLADNVLSLRLTDHTSISKTGCQYLSLYTAGPLMC